VELGKKIDKMVFPGLQGGPLEHVVAGKAVAFREAMQPGFRTYAQAIIFNAKALAGALAERGYRIVSGGTDNHVFLVDVRSKDLTGKEAQAKLDAAGITVNKNMIPFDPTSPFVTSGIRIGTPAITTRGFSVEEMHVVAELIDRALTGADAERVEADVRELARKHPMPSQAT
jgi:glycine hydroxymethyltransferase